MSPDTAVDALVQEALGKWREALLDLTRRNRLLSFTSGNSAVQVAHPSTAVLAAINGGKSVLITPGIIEDGDPPAPAGRGRLSVVTTGGWAALRKAARLLRTRATNQFMDTGLHVLYLAFGLVQWVDVDGEALSSPLLLVPVSFVPGMPADEVAVMAAEEDAAVNPPLRLKLHDLGVDLPELPDPTASVEAWSDLLRQVQAAVAARPGWAVRDHVWLTYFSASKEAMYRDLLDHAEVISAHPQVAALAAAGSGLGPQFHLGDSLHDLSPQRLDETRPPEIHPTVLDADASQRAVIAAVVDGHSLVAAGPPGTGKSQTIANMIAALLHQGRSVLFVSEKAAALEVVANRLGQVGLEPYALQLHSHTTTRAAVSKALAAALQQFPNPAPGLSQQTRLAARQRREQLSKYAAAMNEVRQPLDLSLIAVMGQVAGLHDLPVPDPARHLAEALTPQTVAAIDAAADQLTRAWRPAAQGREFLWRDVIVAGTMTPRLDAAAHALAALQQAMMVNADLCAAFGLQRPSDAPRMVNLMALTGDGVPVVVPSRWWSADLDDVDRVARLLGEQVASLHDAEGGFKQSHGVEWQTVAAVPAIDAAAWMALQQTVVLPHSDRIDHAALRSIAATSQVLADAVTAVQQVADAVTAPLGLPAQTAVDPVLRMLHLLRLADCPTRIDPAWLTPAGLTAARAAAVRLQTTHRLAADAATAATPYFTDAACGHDVAGLATRFATVHTGWAKLGAAYRTDKAAVAAFAQPGVPVKAAVSYLPLAVAWRHAVEGVAAAERDVSASLGRYYQGVATDWAAVTVALDAAEEVVAAYGGDGADLTALAAFLNGEHPDQDVLRPTRVGLAAAVDDLGNRITDAAWSYPFDWRHQPFSALSDRLSTAVTSCTALHDTLQHLDQLVGPMTVPAAARLLADRERLVQLTGALDMNADVRRAILLDLDQGRDTDLPAVRAAAAWVRQVRRVAVSGAELSARQVAALTAATDMDVSPLWQQWTAARDAVLDAFTKQRRGDLAADLDQFDDAADLLAALSADPDGQEEWFACQSAMTVLRQHGLDPVVRFCVEQRVAAADVPAVIRKAVWTGWIDHVLDADVRLQPVRLADRNAIVTDYRALDRQLIDTAISEVLAACALRRPHTLGDQAALLHSEGQKKRRHMPVRELISRSRDVTLAIKPCFMMSPLSVSHYLPSDITFDVVIFDEASQVKPADAINSIYRGRQLVVVGDANQLPPTSFYDATSSSDGDDWDDNQSTVTDFESILDLAGGSAAFDTLTLRTHYRSRHEDLIAFSNHSFYRGALHTFPSARTATDDLGVAFVHVPDGVYGRGGTHDNPVEAEAVIDRVIHHFDTRPRLTLGVVAFSRDQADAIQLALDERIKTRPDLTDRLDVDNRLGGFFIKNLETVQGDERDVIIFSVGYGPDQFGKTTNNFGPVTRSGGWRRLNVAITRARNRVELVSSIRAADVGDTTNESNRHLRRYLDFAERGPAALALDDTGDYGRAESPFEDSVIATLNRWGYNSESQVGTAGYRIDIGVRHPDQTTMFMLGIECDGYAYHSSAVARDRDRIRHEILTGLGWHLHHIWGTAWYRHRESAEQALRDALQQAQHRGPAIPAASHRPVSDHELVTVDLAAAPAWTQPYTIANLPPAPGFFDGPTAPGARRLLQRHVHAVAEAEAPVHLDLLFERLRGVWQVGRVGARIKDAITAAVAADPDLTRDGEFLLLRGSHQHHQLVPVRTPTETVARSIHQVHDSELTNAISQYVRDSRGISADLLVQRIARLFGWNRTGTLIADRVTALIDALITAEEIHGDADRLHTRPSKTA